MFFVPWFEYLDTSWIWLCISSCLHVYSFSRTVITKYTIGSLNKRNLFPHSSRENSPRSKNQQAWSVVSPLFMDCREGFHYESLRSFPCKYAHLGFNCVWIACCKNTNESASWSHVNFMTSVQADLVKSWSILGTWISPYEFGGMQLRPFDLMNLIFSGIYMAQQSHGWPCSVLSRTILLWLSWLVCAPLSEMPYWDHNCDIENHLFWCQLQNILLLLVSLLIKETASTSWVTVRPESCM